MLRFYRYLPYFLPIQKWNIPAVDAPCARFRDLRFTSQKEKEKPPTTFPCSSRTCTHKLTLFCVHQTPIIATRIQSTRRPVLQTTVVQLPAQGSVIRYYMLPRGGHAGARAGIEANRSGGGWRRAGTTTTCTYQHHGGIRCKHR